MEDSKEHPEVKELREKLENELPDGAYQVSYDSKHTFVTGKGGYILYNVAILEEFLNNDLDTNE